MKKSDLFSMAVQNLKNRKTRTKLTVIGVVIGTCAIVIMVSIGIGIDKMITSQYESDTSLNKITVYGSDYMSETEETETLPFDDRAVDYFKSIENVNAVVPTVSVSECVKITRGRYHYGWGTVKGIDLDALEMMGYSLNEGSFAGIDKRNTVFFGEEAVTAFEDSQGNSVKYKYDENYKLSECEIDPMKDIFFISPAVMEDSNGAPSSVPSQRIKVGGIIKRDYTVDYDTSNGIYVDISLAQEYIKQYNKLNPQARKSLEYGEIYVFVNNMGNVGAVKDKIKQAGFSCYSDDEELEYTKKVMMVVQLVLGAIGAISMFVAAFGISNTMVMSVYERTKEIGIMKVLGCDIKDIKSLFLYEAGTIGFMGGTIGIIISYIISITANLIARAVVNSFGEMEDGLLICVSSIPWWLAVSGILFSILIGVVAGLAPANRSVKVSALTAIHNE